eukprot:Blabericola_migrator_1__9303@NODE_4_length_29828_cov_96_571587_g3_i0_p10_GENE_NODE_4_length_29828_cov_96_571587_g3_i0NODE_4_length_29828_cov_96_571587_g3_i0_p10_ORF_typecomplete_len249_score33_37Chromate_transp/PF02417_15/0_044AlaE/PF06610_13/0_44Pox_A14/PF05767_12/2_6Pox_A14/PF05767_12/24_NODE_4_length_29828_cov_96_571587_g3_i02314623892
MDPGTRRESSSSLGESASPRIYVQHVKKKSQIYEPSQGMFGLVRRLLTSPLWKKGVRGLNGMAVASMVIDLIGIVFIVAISMYYDTCTNATISEGLLDFINILSSAIVWSRLLVSIVVLLQIPYWTLLSMNSQGIERSVKSFLMDIGSNIFFWIPIYTLDLWTSSPPSYAASFILCIQLLVLSVYLYQCTIQEIKESEALMMTCTTRLYSIKENVVRESNIWKETFGGPSFDNPYYPVGDPTDASVVQ